MHSIAWGSSDHNCLHSFQAKTLNAINFKIGFPQGGNSLFLSLVLVILDRALFEQNQITQMQHFVCAVEKPKLCCSEMDKPIQPFSESFLFKTRFHSFVFLFKNKHFGVMLWLRLNSLMTFLNSPEVLWMPLPPSNSVCNILTHYLTHFPSSFTTLSPLFPFSFTLTFTFDSSTTKSQPSLGPRHLAIPYFT